jgi:hypothetical protein
MVSRARSLPVLALALSITACGGGGGDSGGGGASSTPPPPPAAATVSLSLSKTSVHTGDSVTLTWSSGNATSCTASGAWSGSQPTSGTTTVTASQTGPSNYQLSCKGSGAAGQGSVTLNVGAAPTQVSVPGLPAPVPVAAGTCVNYSDADFQFNCIATEAAIPAKYETFSSTLSGQVSEVGTAPPTVQAGGSCSAGFNTGTGQFAVNTSFGNDAIAFSGANVTEVVYSSAFLTSIGAQSTITSMSALVIGDNGNTDHFQVIVYANGPSGPITFATGGTFTMNGTTTNLNLLECLGVATAPPPPPPPASLNCPAGRGIGQNGLGFPSSQQVAFNITGTAGSQPNTSTLTWGASYSNPNQTSSSYSGSLRVSLWAVPYNFQGSGPINGTRVAVSSPSFTGTGAKSPNQLYNGYSVTNIVSTASGGNPPSGAYCMVMALDEYNPDTTQCSSSDHFCYADWAQFPGTSAFQ